MSAEGSGASAPLLKPAGRVSAAKVTPPAVPETKIIPKAVMSRPPAFRLNEFFMASLFPCVVNSMLAVMSRERLVPGPGIVPSVPIFKQNNFPDFVHSQMLFPWRHDRGPREPFIRQTDSTLGHPPEDERFL